MTTQNTLERSIQDYQSLIANFINSNNVKEDLRTSFGDNFETEASISILKSLANEELAISIDIVSSSKINNANGAYSSSNNTIYLSTELIDSGDIDAVTRTLLEETGHYLDSQVSSNDAAGDEGAIFASLILGEELDRDRLQLLKAEDDSTIIQLDGASRTIEQQGIIYVNAQAVGLDDGASWANAYTDLQSALTSATTGDQIWVADGTYRPAISTSTDRTASFIIPDGVQVYGGFTGGETDLTQRDVEKNVAILNGDIGTTGNVTDNVYNVVTISDTTRDTILNGFTITGGNATGGATTSSTVGGGIYSFNSSAILRNLNIVSNTASSGGGIYTEDSQHELINIQFLNNNASFGGGLYTDNSINSLTGVTFGYNSSDNEGGGIYNGFQSTLNLSNVEFIANRAVTNGGGISSEGLLSLFDGVFLNNSALANGGGIYSDTFSSESTPFAISNTIFKSNVADLGGGFYNTRSGDIPGTVTNSLFTDNYSIFGGGIYNESSSTRIINSTLANNISQYGSAVSSEGLEDNQPSITNSILWDNLSAFGQDPIYDSGSVTGASFSLVEGGFSGEEIVDKDPLFVNPNSFDYRLNTGSPALDVGINDAASGDTDLSSNPRIANEIVDLGAYEGAKIDPVPTEPQFTANPTIVYVNQSATGEDDGTSWANAYTSLQNALTSAPAGSQIWVADGTYTPSLDDRTASFQLRNTISLYGGFSGVETSLSERDPVANQTILSGDIGQNANTGDNSYHVVNASNVTTSAVLDGFIIADGNANEFVDSLSDTYGGGIYSESSQATFRNLRIENNNAEQGGGIYISDDSSHILTNVTFASNSSSTFGGAVYNAGNTYFFDNEFSNNTTEREGGAIYNQRTSIYVEGTTFNSNRATEAGGAIYFDDFSTGTYERVVNSVFNNNDSPAGGAIYNSSTDAQGTNLTFANNEAENGPAVYSEGNEDNTNPTYTNSIFWDNDGTSSTAQIFNEGDNTVVSNSIVQGGYEGINILDNVPQFANQEEGDLRILDTSPAIDAGDNSVVITDEDISDTPRVVNNTVDLGAYEFNNDDPAPPDTTDPPKPDGPIALSQTINRFQNKDISGTYLFAGEEESESIRENNPNFEEEGTAFKVSFEPGEDLIPLYRFQSIGNPGTYLFVGEEERQGILENFSNDFNEEGLAFYVYGVGEEKGTTFYRFQNEDKPGTYLFAGPEERENIVENFPNFTEEGVAFEVGI
jgi:predicted outer membrane repeat protein